MREPLVGALLDLLRPEIERLVDQRVQQKLVTVTIAHRDPWLTTLEAAQYLRLSPEALRARARRGTIPAHRDGQRLLFHREELDQCLGRHDDRNGRYLGARQADKWPRAVAPAGAVAPRRKP